MLSKNQIKYIESLKSKKYRKKHGTFIAEGEKIVAELLNASFEITSIFALAPWTDKYAALIKNYKDKIHIVAEKELAKISCLSTPNQALAVVKLPAHHYSAAHLSQNNSNSNTTTPVLSLQLPLQNPILVLDSIRDPGNLGTIIRTADWFGLSHIICSPDCVDAFNPKVIQSTMGSFLRMQLFYTSLVPFLAQYPTTPIYGALLEGKSIYQTSFKDQGFIVIGNESKGISKTLLPLINRPITIPRIGQSESLNAGIATGIICAYARKMEG